MTSRHNHQIHEVTPSDYPALISVWENSVRATHHFLAESDIEYYRPLILNQYFDQLKLFCIKKDGDIIGFIGLDEELIQMLFVHSDAIGLGIGKTLISFAIENHSVNKVEVNEQNEQATGFYKHIGFEVTDRHDLDGNGRPYPILSMVLRQKTALRKATIADIPAIMRLYQETVLTTCTNEYDENQLKVWAALGQNPERWQARIHNQHFLIAESARGIAGFASLSAEGYLDVFYVHKEQQRKGIAFMLYQELEKHATSISLATITADVSKTAKSFFEKQGFLTLSMQENQIEGQILINYKMEKRIG